MTRLRASIAAGLLVLGFSFNFAGCFDTDPCAEFAAAAGGINPDPCDR